MRLDPHPQPREAGGCLLDSKHRNRPDTFPSLGGDHISGRSFPTRPRTRLVTLDAARSQESLALLVTLTNRLPDLELLLTLPTASSTHPHRMQATAPALPTLLEYFKQQVTFKSIL